MSRQGPGPRANNSLMRSASTEQHSLKQSMHIPTPSSWKLHSGRPWKPVLGQRNSSSHESHHIPVFVPHQLQGLHHLSAGSFDIVLKKGSNASCVWPTIMKQNRIVVSGFDFVNEKTMPCVVDKWSDIVDTV